MNKLLKLYNQLEDNNDHTGAAKLLVDTFGTESEKQEMKEILERHNNIGHIVYKDYSRRYEISQKYYKLLHEKGTSIKLKGLYFPSN